MELLKISNSGTKEFRIFWEVYIDSFDRNERRSLESQVALLSNELYELSAILKENQQVGFLATWEFDKVIFVEHLAIAENFRNKGIGTALLSDYLAQKKKLIVGEVDRPEDEISKRRIGLYQRLGCRLNTYDYIQPPYEQDREPVLLYLMTFPREINNDEFLEIRSQLHRLVYGCKEALETA